MFFDTQHYHGVIAKGLFANRIYIDAKNETYQKNAFKCDLKGAGFCSYDGLIGRIIGCILSLFARAAKVKIGSKTCYINTKSFVHHILRRKFHSFNPTQMHQNYLQHKKGLKYDLEIEKKIEAYFLKNVQGKESKDIWDLIESCLKEIRQSSPKKSLGVPLQVIKLTTEKKEEATSSLPVQEPRQAETTSKITASESTSSSQASSSSSTSLKLENFDLTALRNLNLESDVSESQSSFASEANDDDSSYSSSSVSSTDSSFDELLPDDDYSSMDYSSSDGSDEEMLLEEWIETDAFKSMCKNARLAITEHQLAAKKLEPNKNVLIGDVAKKSLRSETLQFQFSISAAQGKRKTMEDQYFLIEFPQAAFLGILDGHSGADVAHYASKVFKGEFLAVLNRKKGNVQEAFIYLTTKIQQKICSKEDSFACQGSTAVLCYMDKKAKLIYTATLGDCEAKIYSLNNDKINVTPLSCVRNWASEEDKQRALRLNPHLENKWANLDPKAMRILGSNASRALGDKVSKAVSQEPIVTVESLSKGDTIILACDGYWDYVDEYQAALLVKEYSENAPEKSLSHYLGDYALFKGKSDDNVTVIAVNVR